MASAIGSGRERPRSSGKSQITGERDQAMHEDSIQAETKQSLLADGTAAPKTSDQAWELFAKRLYARDKAIAEAWKDEIEALLTFSGLFAAVVSVFLVDLYKLLQPSETSPDTTSTALIQLVAILSNGTISPIPVIPAKAVKPPNSAVWVNSLMFASLITVLSSAFIGIIVRQWLNFFLSPPSGTGEQRAYIHCLRWDKGLEKWQVHKIISVISVLLQVSVALFLSGILVLLWPLNRNVAVVATAFTGALGTFWMCSTIAPSIYRNCPYKSPQALAFHWTTHRYGQFRGFVRDVISRTAQCWTFRRHHQVLQDDTYPARRDRRSPVRWAKLHRTWAKLEQDAIEPLMRCGESNRGEAMQRIQENVFALGHSLLMDDDLLYHVVPLCLTPPHSAPYIVPGSINATMDTPQFQGINEISEREAIASSLKRLRLLFLDDAMSTETWAKLSSTAVTLLERDPPLLLQALHHDAAEHPIWDIVPHLCAGGGPQMASVLKYLALSYDKLQNLDNAVPLDQPTPNTDQPLLELVATMEIPRDSILKNDLQYGFNRVSTNSNNLQCYTKGMGRKRAMELVAAFVHVTVNYDQCWRIWLQEPVTLFELSRDNQFLAAIVRHISGVVLEQQELPSTRIVIPPHYNASYLAMFLVRSIPQAQWSRNQISPKLLMPILQHMQYYRDRSAETATPIDGRLTSHLNQGYEALTRSRQLLEQELNRPTPENERMPESKESKGPDTA